MNAILFSHESFRSFDFNFDFLRMKFLVEINGTDVCK